MNQVVGQERIHYDLESSGTKKLIGLALNILFNPEEKVFVFDEFDDAFHQEFVRNIVRSVQCHGDEYTIYLDLP